MYSMLTYSVTKFIEKCIPICLWEKGPTQYDSIPTRPRRWWSTGICRPVLAELNSVPYFSKSQTPMDTRWKCQSTVYDPVRISSCDSRDTFSRISRLQIVYNKLYLLTERIFSFLPVYFSTF